MFDAVGSASQAKPTNSDSITPLGATAEKSKVDPTIAGSTAMNDAAKATLICVLNQPSAAACISTAGLGSPPSFGTPAQPATAESGDVAKAGEGESKKTGGIKVKVGEDPEEAKDKKLLKEFKAFKAAQEDGEEKAEGTAEAPEVKPE